MDGNASGTEEPEGFAEPRFFPGIPVGGVDIEDGLVAVIDGADHYMATVRPELRAKGLLEFLGAEPQAFVDAAGFGALCVDGAARTFHAVHAGLVGALIEFFHFHDAAAGRAGAALVMGWGIGLGLGRS